MHAKYGLSERTKEIVTLNMISLCYKMATSGLCIRIHRKETVCHYCNICFWFIFLGITVNNNTGGNEKFKHALILNLSTHPQNKNFCLILFYSLFKANIQSRLKMTFLTWQKVELQITNILSLPVKISCPKLMLSMFLIFICVLLISTTKHGFFICWIFMLFSNM